MKIKSTDGALILSYRRCGNTTRIVDNAIQLLFKGYEVEFRDHLNPTYNHIKNIFANRLIKRIEFEHNIEWFDVDYTYLTISLKDKSLEKET